MAIRKISTLPETDLFNDVGGRAGAILTKDDLLEVSVKGTAGASGLSPDGYASAKISVEDFRDAPIVSATTATAHRLIRRGASGRAQIATPSADADIANKGYVDATMTSSFTPDAYAGEESITFPNGLIMKTGRIARTARDTLVVFSDPFPTAITSIQITAEDTDNRLYEHPALLGSTKSVAGFNIRTKSDPSHFYWTAIGY
jgi:hypothetical protein